MYHSTGGGRREEEDELFNKRSLRDITVASNWDALITEGTRTMRWLQRERTLSTTKTQNHTALRSLNKHSSCFHEWRRDSSGRCVTGECSLVVLVPASPPAAAVCACKEAESSAAWSPPPCLWTCWDQNLTPADRQNSSCSTWSEIIAGRGWTCGTAVDPSTPTETTGHAYLVCVVKRFSVTFDWSHIFIPKHKRAGSNKTAREMYRCERWLKKKKKTEMFAPVCWFKLWDMEMQSSLKSSNPASQEQQQQ